MDIPQLEKRTKKLEKKLNKRMRKANKTRLKLEVVQRDLLTARELVPTG